MDVLRRRKRLFLALGVFWVTGMACSIFGRLPEVTHYPQPTLRAETAVFQDAGCNEPGGQCAPQSVLGKLGCERIYGPGDLLGGLSPALPINICETRETLAEGAYLYQEGCLLPSFVRLVVEQDGAFRLIESQKDLQATYAPVESQEEALSYAIAATGLGARYGLEAQKGWRYFVDDLSDTNVRQTVDGYRVLLYDYHLCGCGPHTTFAVEVFVTPEGQVSERQRIPVFEDPEEDGLCVD